jgi:hypothetical protein
MNNSANKTTAAAGLSEGYTQLLSRALMMALAFAGIGWHDLFLCCTPD